MTYLLTRLTRLSRVRIGFAGIAKSRREESSRRERPPMSNFDPGTEIILRTNFYQTEYRIANWESLFRKHLVKAVLKSILPRPEIPQFLAGWYTEINCNWSRSTRPTVEKKHELTMFRLKFSFDGLLCEILKIDQIKVRLSVFRILRKLDLYFVYSKNHVLSR